MARRVHGINVGGEGRKAEIDGGYFGGYVKPAKHVENRRDRRLRQYQSGKRKDVVVIREREARHSEVAALNFIRTRIARGTTVYADEAGAWNELHGRFTMHRVGMNLRATRSLMDFA
jgi:ISXO2-like transposase domain